MTVSKSVQSGALLSTSEVVSRLGISETTLWRMEKRGEFPKPIVLSRRCKRWRETDLNDYIAKAGG